MSSSAGGYTTSAFHQATQANSVSYPLQDGKWVSAESAMTFCGWGVKQRWKPVGSTGAGCQSGRVYVWLLVHDRPPS